MKKNIKSLIGVLLCLVMLMSLMGTAAFADDPVISPSFTKDEKWEETPGETYTGVLCWDPHYTAVKWKEIAGSEDFVSDGIWNEITELASGEDTITVSKLSAFLMIDYKTSENDEDGNQLVIDLNSTLLSQIAVAGEGYDMSKEYSTDGYTWKEYVDGYADLDGADKFFVRDKAMPTSAEASQFVLVSANTALDNVQYVPPITEGEPILDPNPGTPTQDPNPENQNGETLNPENLNLGNLNLGNPNQALDAQSLNLENLNNLNLVSLNQELQTGGNQTGGNQTGEDQTGEDQTGGNQTGEDQTGGNQTGEDQTGGNQIGENQNQTLNLPQKNQANEKQILSDPPPATEYPLWVGGTRVTSSILSGTGWVFHPELNILELTGNITLSALGENNPEVCAAIYYNDQSETPKTLNIAVEADSTVSCAVSGQNDVYGIYAENNLSFVSKAAHKLTVYSIAANISSTAIKCGTIDVDSKVTLEAASGAAKDSKGIDSGSITNNGTIRATSSEKYYNIYEPSTFNSSVAMKVDGSVILKNENSSIEASAGAAYSSVAINAAVIDITKGSITAQSLQASANDGLYTATGTAILANTLDMKGGTITAAAASGLQTSEGMRIDNASTMSNGTLTVSSGDAYTSSIALNIANGSLTASAGTINANSSGANGKGISGQLIVTGNATVTAQGGESAFAAKPSIEYTPNEPQVLAGTAAPGERKTEAQIAQETTYTGNKYVNISTIVPVSTITLNKSALSLREGAQEQLTATILPENATDKTVTWRSSDERIATVDNTGLVTAVARGVPCTITATSSNSTIPVATCTVTVTEGTHANQIILDKTTLTIEEGGTGEISFSVRPDDATSKSVRVTSMDETVATLSNPTTSTSKVTVSGRKAGTTKLLFNSADPSSTAPTVECTVTVTPKIKVNSITIVDETGKTPSTLSFTAKGASKKIHAIVNADATSKKVNWTVTGDNQVVYLTEIQDLSVVVNSWGNGRATLTASADGLTNSIDIIVNDTQSTYKFTYKENSGVWYYDYGTLATYTVKCDGPYSSFSGCLMDGYIVSPSYYYVTEGSTIVTFYPAYMQTLSHGRHTLTFVYNGTTTVSTYIWSRSLRDPPITGDSGTAGLIAAMSVSALAAASCTFFVRKKKEN